MFAILSAWLACVLFASFGILDLPRIGAVFSTNDGAVGMSVKDVRAGLPAHRAGLRDGDVVTGIRSVRSGDGMTLSEAAGIRGRHQAGSYELWARARSERAKLWTLIEKGDVVLETRDGRELTLRIVNDRVWTDLPAAYWLILVHSFAVIAISAGIAAFAPHSAVTGLLLVSGASLSANLLSHAVRTALELVFSPTLADFVYLSSNISSVLFAFSLLALLWHTPHPPARFPFAALSVGFGLFAFAVQHFQLFAFPLHPFQFPYLLALVAAVVLLSVKWIRARGRPLDRAALSWVALSIFVAVVPWIAIYPLPIILIGRPLIDPDFAGLVLTAIFVGFAFGATKFRLFGIHAIWWRTLIWLSIGIGVVLLDAVFLSLFNWSQQQALPAAIMLASWLYFPIKNFVHDRWVNRNAFSLDDAGLKLFDHLTAIADPDEFNGRFIGFLRKLFRVADVEIDHVGGRKAASILDNGLGLSVPALDEDHAYVLRGRAGGQRLFSDADRKAANVLLRLARGIRDQKIREFDLRNADRARIVRDLHDDVGAKLLALIFAARDRGDIGDRAQQALRALKDAMLLIEKEESADIDAEWPAVWREQAARLVAGGFDADMSLNFSGARVVAMRDFVNLTRIVEEHVSNILKYASRDVKVTGVARLTANGGFAIEMNSGNSGGAIESTGRGAGNMRARAEECRARLDVGADAGDYRFRLWLPLPD